VTEHFLKALLNLDWIRQNYSISDVTLKRYLAPYGTLILSQLPFEDLFVYQVGVKRKLLDLSIFFVCVFLSIFEINVNLIMKDWPTRQGRDHLFGIVTLNGKKVVVTTTHLESLSTSTDRRILQMAMVFFSFILICFLIRNDFFCVNLCEFV
jgi:hypothetical protein